MKNLLLFLSVVFACLLCTGTVNGALLSEERGEAEYGLQANELLTMAEAEQAAGFFLPVSSKQERDMAFEDAQSLARQLRLVNRSQRTLVLPYTLLDKGVLTKVAKCCMDIIHSSINHSYTSLPYQSWGVSSEHYIFGMRRILI